MSATAGREYPTEREMDRRAWDAALAKREMVAAVAEWHPLTPDPMEQWRCEGEKPYEWRLRDRLIVGAIIGAGCGLWLWVIWRGVAELTR